MTLKTLAWRTALKDPIFRIRITFTLLLLVTCAFISPVLFNYIEKRPGTALYDPVLELLQPADFSILIFSLLYFLIIVGVIQVIKSPGLLLMGIQAYLVITVMRFITLLVTPLEAPEGILVLKDPFVDKLFYQQTVTKDLFFSGHTGTVSLFIFLLYNQKGWRYLYMAGTLFLGMLLLWQHVHYTVDVLAAPVLAWGAAKLSFTFGYGPLRRPNI
jgi:hypothetical protein